MRLEHVEVVDGVAEVVAVRAHAQAERLGREPERRAVLAAALERTQAQLGVGLRDRGRRSRTRSCARRGGTWLLLLLLLGVGAGRDHARREVAGGDLLGGVGEAADHAIEQQLGVLVERVQVGERELGEDAADRPLGPRRPGPRSPGSSSGDCSRQKRDRARQAPLEQQERDHARAARSSSLSCLRKASKAPHDLSRLESHSFVIGLGLGRAQARHLDRRAAARSCRRARGARRARGTRRPRRARASPSSRPGRRARPRGCARRTRAARPAPPRGRVRETSRCSRLRSSHISLEICSRTPRAFSRARATQAVTASGLAGCQSMNSVTLRRRVVGEVLAVDLVAAEQQDQLAPGAPAVGQVGVEQPVEVHVQQAARVLGPLDVAARPVERLCDPAQHQARSTQVSLLPPPCEELTTSEPSRSAARVSPPGTTRRDRGSRARTGAGRRAPGAAPRCRSACGSARASAAR